MYIRDADQADIPQLCGLIADFYAEAPYDAPLINPDKAAHVFDALIAAPADAVYIKVIEHQGMIVGGLLAERQEDIWSDAHKVVELFMYVHPPYRKRPAVGKLLLDFKRWTQEIPSVVRVEASSGINDEDAAKVFKKLGWRYRGMLYGSEAY